MAAEVTPLSVRNAALLMTAARQEAILALFLDPIDYDTPLPTSRSASYPGSRLRR